MENPTVNLPRFERLPRTVAIDLDGTLLNSRTRVSERNAAAVSRCASSGIPVIIATSRPARTARRALGDDLSAVCSFIIMNGAVAWTAPPLVGTVKLAFPEEVTRGIIALLERHEPEVRLTLEIDGYEFGSNIPRTAEELWRVNAATPEMMLSVEAAMAKRPAKIAASRGGKDASDLADAVLAHFGDVAVVVQSDGGTLLNIVTIEASKSATLGRLLAPHGISLDEVLAFGDDMPDVDLLTACGTAVAMGNCVPAIRKLTEFCTVGNDEDGVAVVLEAMLDAAGV